MDLDYSQFLSMSHEVSLVVVLIVLLLADLLIKNKKAFQYLAIAAFALHTVAGFCYYTDMAGDAFAGMYVSGAAQSFVKNILNVGTLLVFFFSFEWNNKENKSGVGEFYFLTLSTLIGMYFMISAGDFLFFYIGLETASIPMAALVAMNKKGIEGAEAAAKYILTASFSSGVMLFGISLIYGACGSLYFDEVQAAFTDITPLHIFALVCFIAGVGFKISLVPFHFWTADTYQGAPTGVTAYLSVISKGAAVFAFMCILYKAFVNEPDVWQGILWWLIVITITIGNLFALRQKNLKRFLAFSSISQAGYIMLGVYASSQTGMSSTIYYILIYMFTNLAAFGIISAIENKTGKVGMDDYNALYTTNPKLAFAMTLAMFSLGGIPPFAGFFSKFFIFASVAESKVFGDYVLVFLALLNTIISLYYYLLVVKAMFINKSDSPIETIKIDAMSRVALLVCVIAILVIGFISAIYMNIYDISFGFAN
ncbi:MAG: NADH-quinone oxidoreductase subunit N [Paludibacteraceae bacterium]|nr:NADH-quinone oxidoreductase subunit N [Bacteroidales bacterium]MEE1177023.1 NADH-quinone oxidoreductase subunit N [Paludibacteraceae bacterium]